MIKNFNVTVSEMCDSSFKMFLLQVCCNLHELFYKGDFREKCYDIFHFNFCVYCIHL